jgi:two-component system, NarL family, response regulator DegU
MEALRILIADDHPVVLMGLSNLIRQEKDFDLLHAATDGQEALDKISTYKPEVIILDVEMPKLTGLEVAEKVLNVNAEAKIILLTFLKDQGIFNKAMDMGILGYMLKENALTELLHAIKHVSMGLPYLSPSMSEFMLNWKKRNSPDNPINQFTRQEQQILKLIAQKKTTPEIAEMLFISPKTVEHHRSNISKKLQLGGNHNSIRDWAIEHQDWFS